MSDPKVFTQFQLTTHPSAIHVVCQKSWTVHKETLLLKLLFMWSYHLTFSYANFDVVHLQQTQISNFTRSILWRWE